MHYHHRLYNTFPIQCSPLLCLCSVYWQLENKELHGKSLYITCFVFFTFTSIHKLIIWMYVHVFSYFVCTHIHTERERDTHILTFSLPMLESCYTMFIPVSKLVSLKNKDKTLVYLVIVPWFKKFHAKQFYEFEVLPS